MLDLAMLIGIGFALAAAVGYVSFCARMLDSDSSPPDSAP
jgi:hypothetical protein